MIGLGVYFVVRFVLLSGALWALLRAQDLNYTIPGLLGSSALASLCDMIPLMGHPLAAAVLLFCVLKLTGAHLVDVRFTVTISYAIMFLVQMLVLSAMPTPTHVRARDFGILNPNVAMTAKDQAALDADDSDLFGRKPKTAAIPAAKPKISSNTIPTPVAAVKSIPAPVTSEQTAAQTVAALTKNWKLKGIMGSGPQTTAMIGAAGKTYTFGIGETLKMNTSNGKTDVTLEEATQQYVVLNVNGTKVALTLH